MSYLTSLAARTPRLIAIGPSQTTEVVRWSLDRLGISYQEVDHVPIFHTFFTYLAGSTINAPLLQVGETTLTTNRAILDYYDARSLEADRLVPAEEAKAIIDKFDFYNGDFSFAVGIWTYGYLLKQRSTTFRLWTWHVGWVEGLLALPFYPLLALMLRHGWGITTQNIEASLEKVEAAFAEVEKQLSDGRPYLFGQRFTAADVAFASNAAPLVLPGTYGGPQAPLDSLPTEIKVQINKFRESVAGKWVLHLYETQRGKPAEPALPPISFGSRLNTILTGWTSPWLGNFIIRTGFNLLRTYFPFRKFGKTVIVSDFSQVTEVLGNERAFSILQINAKRMENTVGPFVLGMDASNPRWRPEKDLLNAAVGRQDLELIPAISQQHAARLLKAAQGLGRIEAVNGYTRLAALRFVRTYFGVPGPDEPTMARWMRTLFNELFLNIGNDPATTQIAKQSAAEMQVYLRNLIAERIDQQNKNSALPTDVLGRLLRECPTGDLLPGDEAVRRSISGLIIGAVDTTSSASIRVVDELLRRPNWLKKAAEVAQHNNLKDLNGYVLEALRFNPHNPLQLRYCANDHTLTSGNLVPAGSTTVAGTLSGMFDKNVFPDPTTFNPNRDQDNYLHYGYGMHACQGRYINGLQITTLVGGLLKLKNLRRVSGTSGHLLFDGPFPDQLVLAFDPEPES